MSTLKKIFVRNFRNIESAELSFCPSINCVCGDNGQGKTSLLDAIHYLSMTKSSLGVADSFCVRKGTDGFALAGTYDMPDGMISKFAISCDGGGKTVKRDDKAYKRLCEHIGRLPIVMVSPMDSALVTESGEERRRFANSVLSQMDIHYLLDLQKYNRLLLQRNSMLKKGMEADASLLDVIEEQMGLLSVNICSSRAAFTRELAASCASVYSRLSGGGERMDIRYRSDMNGLDASGLSSLFKERRQRDFILGYTGEGIQRDDFEFLINGMPLRRCGSQGQQKTFLVAVKISQFEIMKSRNASVPILLLDDLFDKLDNDRTGRLLSLFSGSGFGQIFISDTSRQRIGSIISTLGGTASFFKAVNGEINADEAI